MKIKSKMLKKILGSVALLAFVFGSFGGSLGTTVNKAYADDTAKVTIVKYIDGAMATAITANNTDFPMSASWVVGGNPNSGQYALSETGYNGDPTPYQAATSDMPTGSDYSTNEIVDGVLVGNDWTGTAPYSLVGYTYGQSLQQAANATPTLTPPSFTNLTSNKYVIVWNHDCANTNGEIGGNVTGGLGNGELEVTSIETVNGNAVANGTFASGWKHIFNVTVPSDETDVAMKFANWAQTGGPGVILVANNMRISSAQANNGGATILLTAANVYSTPDLTMTVDLDPLLAGIQVKILVETSIPVGSNNGAYTTTYGIQTQ